MIIVSKNVEDDAALFLVDMDDKVHPLRVYSC
jgi:hypothetical protein